MTLTAEAPLYLSDNGSMFWPPECDLDGAGTGVAFSQSWEKYDDEAQRREILLRKRSVTCSDYLPYKIHGLKRCNTRLEDWRQGPQHQFDAHRWWDPAKGWVLDPINLHATWPRWTYEMMGFADLWDGKPMGWQTLFAPGDRSAQQYEMDRIELSAKAADHWWVDGERAGGA